jgi:RimJ/RimL family protein N-acetyltransferase
MTTVQPIFAGKLVRLASIDFEKDPAVISAWGQDSEYQHLQDAEAARLFSGKQEREWLEKESDENCLFGMRVLEDDRLIGVLSLEGFDWAARNAWLSIGIGERSQWGKGYGTDAMRIILRYAFHTLNLNRVTLTVFEENPRAQHCYEKCGFQEEGRARQFLNRRGTRSDLIYMGILRADWLRLNDGL